MYLVASSKQGPNHSASIDQEIIIPRKANMFWFFSTSKENKMFFLPTYPNFFETATGNKESILLGLMITYLAHLDYKIPQWSKTLAGHSEQVCLSTKLSFGWGGS